jgi:catalase
MRVDGNQGSTLGYEPSSYGEWQQQPAFAEPPLGIEGSADRWNYPTTPDAGRLPRSLSWADLPERQLGANVRIADHPPTVQ